MVTVAASDRGWTGRPRPVESVWPGDAFARGALAGVGCGGRRPGGWKISSLTGHTSAGGAAGRASTTRTRCGQWGKSVSQVDPNPRGQSVPTAPRAFGSGGYKVVRGRALPRYGVSTTCGRTSGQPVGRRLARLEPRSPPLVRFFLLLPSISTCPFVRRRLLLGTVTGTSTLFGVAGDIADNRLDAVRFGRRLCCIPNGCRWHCVAVTSMSVCGYVRVDAGRNGSGQLADVHPEHLTKKAEPLHFALREQCHCQPLLTKATTSSNTMQVRD